jgi:hypothetical protein
MLQHAVLIVWMGYAILRLGLAPKAVIKDTGEEHVLIDVHKTA